MSGRTEAGPGLQVPVVRPKDKKRWGKQLRLARVDQGISQAEAGDATGLQGPTVSRAELGRGSLDVYHKLASHLGVTLEAGDGS